MSGVKEKFDTELFHVRRSVKYHEHRQRFFEKVQNAAMLGSFVGSVSFIALVVYFSFAEEKGPSVVMLGVVPGLITAMATAFSLLSKAGEKSNLHNTLKTRFIRLRQEMERNRKCTGEQVAEWTAQRLDIEVDELPINRVVDAICHNAVVQSMGIEDSTDYVRVTGWHRFFGLFTRYVDSHLRMYKCDEKGPLVLSR